MQQRQLRAYWTDDGTWHYMVAARNQAAAAPLLGVSLYYLRQSGGRVTRTSDLLVALSEPGRVWKKRIDYGGAQPWGYADA